MRRNHFADQLTLAFDHKFLVVQRETAALADQCRNLRLLQKEFVEPRNLREDLQVGIILRLKELYCTFCRRAAALELVPQLGIARVAGDQSVGICLK
jgi:hypothetical protein